MEFIDIPGASGAVYRFRRWPAAGSHPPIAGNYLVIVEKTRKVVRIGVTDDLSCTRSALTTLPRGSVLFTRLNVTRREREAEHADIALQHASAEVDGGQAQPAEAA